ncbi:MAG: tetratricopeptide repeat-containing protein [Pseudomonadota bacterium]
MPLSVLISHTHAEKELAKAWHDLLQRTSQGAIAPWFSSSTDREGGMEAARRWRDTLDERLKTTELVLAILSPASCDRPWILWECGVVSGRRAAIEGDRAGSVVPVLISLEPRGLRNPLSDFQLYRGDARPSVVELCERLAKAAGLSAPQADLWGPVLDAYMARIDAYRPRPAGDDGETASLWLDRFEALEREGRRDEIRALRDQMYTIEPVPYRPKSAALHDFLSAIMLELNDAGAAVAETEHGLALNPHDVTLHHRQALARLDLMDHASAASAVEALIAQAPELAANPEIAGLKGRIHRERYALTRDPADLSSARAAYERAAQATSTDYYCALNAGVLALDAGAPAEADPWFQQASRNATAARDGPSVSFWADFTLGDIAFWRGESDVALAHYAEGLTRTPPPGPRARAAAKRGALRMLDTLKSEAALREQVTSLFEGRDGMAGRTGDGHDQD